MGVVTSSLPRWVRGAAGRRSWLAVGALALVATLVGFGVLLRDAQREGVNAAERRFAERAQVSAALTQSVFRALASSSGAQLAHQFGGSRGHVLAALQEQARNQLRPSHVTFSAVLDHRGHVVASVGRMPRYLAVGEALHGGPSLSDVRREPAGTVVEYGLKFTGSDGARLLAQGVPVLMMRAFLNDYLARLPNPDDAVLTMVDGAGTPLASDLPKETSSGETITTSARVPGTRWRLRLEAQRSRVIAGLARMPWLAWTLLVSLAAAMLAGLWLYRSTVRAAWRQRQANVALRESKDKLAGLVDALEEAVFLRHADGRVDLLNAAAKKMFDTEEDVLWGQIRGWVILDEDGEPLELERAPARTALATKQLVRQVIGIQRPDGSRAWIEVRARPLVRPGEDDPYAVVSSCTDVTERRELELHLMELAEQDPLTGLWNRRRFEKDLAQQIARCGRYDEHAALLVFDIDGFKQVNDTLGHLTGDDVLRAIAQALTARLRTTDSAARLGGDEFAILLLNASDEQVDAIAADLQERLMKAARTIQGSIELSLSIGIAALNRDTESVAEALAAADRAMYAEKQRSFRVASSSASALPPVAHELGADSVGVMPILAAVRSVTGADVAWLARSTAHGALVEAVADDGDGADVVPGETLAGDGCPTDVKAFLSVPVPEGDIRAASSLCVARRNGGAPFAAEERERMESLAPLVAQQLGRGAALRAGTELASLRALLAAVNARDSYTGGHSRQVVTLARSVASHMGLADEVVTEVEHVALLHDLGKIAVPDSILRKRGPLAEHEEAVMRQHPIVGGEIVASTPELAHLAPAIRAEHERWDGVGYPDGLSGEEIPIASRITFVCDAYHAMTSHRPYRRAMSSEEAQAEIARCAGTQFCPRAAEALLEILSARPSAALAVG